MRCITKGCKNEAREGRQICNTCKTRKYRAAHKIRSLYIILRTNAKRRGKEFDLTLSQFTAFCNNTGYAALKGKTANSFSIDRIDNDKGYTFSNIRSITLRHNSRKGAKSYVPEEAFTPTEEVPF